MKHLKSVIHQLHVLSGTRDLSPIRLEQLLFLCDWYNCLLHGNQMTEVTWELPSMVWSPKVTAQQKRYLTGKGHELLLPEPQLEVIRWVHKRTEKMMFNELVSLVQGSFPLNEPTLYFLMNLPRSAQAYHAQHPESVRDIA